MVNKCCAIQCRSGYTGETKDLAVTFHSFPLNNPELLRVWMKRLARKDFTPTKYSRLCSLHFKPEDFVSHSIDQQARRKQKRGSTLLERKRLKIDAAPSIFKGIPDHYLCKDVPSRSGLSLSSSRREKEAAALDDQCEFFLNQDKVVNFEELYSKTSNEAQDRRFLVHKTEEHCNFILLSHEQCPLSIQATVTVTSCLEVIVYHKQQLVPSASYNHIMLTNKVTLLSEITNLLAFAKNLNLETNQAAKENTFQFNLSQMINKQLEVTENDQHIRLFKFILEQVDLLYKSKKQRRYSIQLLMIAYIIHATSPRAYERLIDEHVLTFPSVKTLKKITLKLDRTTGLDDSQYLKMRFGQLNAFDQNILLMIDEIYLSKRVEATRGEVFGLTENCEVASTALCFMIKSCSSAYQDMVGIFPVKSLKAETQKKCFDKVMELVHNVIFNVIAVSVNNAAINRKFYKDFLCNGTLKECIDNPHTGGSIFLLFDPTHIVKNIYNNFLSRRVFTMPAIPPLVPNAVSAKFSDIETVYSKECHKPLKHAYKLTETVLKPKAFKKVNVKLAMAFVHESTINALKIYGFPETAMVLQLFAKLWSVLNVSSSTIGKHKRHITWDPVRSAEDWKLKFLLEFETFATVWKNSSVSFDFVLNKKVDKLFNLCITTNDRFIGHYESISLICIDECVMQYLGNMILAFLIALMITLDTFSLARMIVVNFLTMWCLALFYNILSVIILQLPGLTKETSLALCQTCKAIAGLSKYLLNFCQFNYVLLGKIQSDTIEGRFGHIRQSSGANYFVSMRQMYESDRKLRAFSLLKYSKISLKEIDNAAKATAPNQVASDVILRADSIAADLHLNRCPDENDAAVIFYVSGYCSRSLAKANKCDSCKETTVASVEIQVIDNMDTSIPQNVANFFNEINRGGLWKPNENTFRVGTLCWQVFSELSVSRNEVRQQFLSSLNQRRVFQEIINVIFYENCTDFDFSTMCAKGHNVLEGISSRFFNCMMKNFMRNMCEEDSRKSSRKIRKLTSG